MKSKIILAGFLPLLLAACSQEPATNVAPAADSSPSAAGIPRPWYKFEQVSAGARVFQANCAACHGKQAEGADNWRKTGADGKYPAPPLNGSGHAWHHPLNILFHTIKNGSPGGQGNMPAWAGKLRDEEIVAVIAWMQSKWPREIYQSWVQRDAAARAGRG